MAQAKAIEPIDFEKGCNEKFFSASFRGKFHFARLDWLIKKLNGLDCTKNTYLELGYFDGKTLDYLPDNFVKYCGYDANRENVLEIVRQKYADSGKIELVECSNADEFNHRETYDISISMETFEYLTKCGLEKYIEKLANSTRYYLLASVPNERGLFRLLKYISKVTFFEEKEWYSFKDILNITIGNLHKVRRNEGRHKVFTLKNYMKFLKSVLLSKLLNSNPSKMRVLC